jgi:hypothetical protein
MLPEDITNCAFGFTGEMFFNHHLPVGCEIDPERQTEGDREGHSQAVNTTNKVCEKARQ